MKVHKGVDYMACEQAFHEYCADELVDPRLQDILEEAFIAGYVAGVFQPHRRPATASTGQSRQLLVAP
jgi:hypothetical protein